MPWWARARVTGYANRFDTDGVVFRLHLLAGMLAVVGLAASTSAAVGLDGAKFAGCCVLLRRLRVSLYARAFREYWPARPPRSTARPPATSSSRAGVALTRLVASASKPLRRSSTCSNSKEGVKYRV